MMKPNPTFDPGLHDANDPSPWLALYLDRSTPLPDHVKSAWLNDSSSVSRQYLLPFVRPLARLTIILIQIVKVLLPKKWVASKALHWILAEGMKRFLAPEANWLILRHFHLGSQILAFVAKNAPTVVSTNALKPLVLDDLKDELFLKHDLNLFNFVITLNAALREKGQTLNPVTTADFSMIDEPTLTLADMPNSKFNFMDSQTAIEFFTPIYQLFLTDNDFWRASNSLQLDETIAIYCATILSAHNHLFMLNNKHPLVPLSTLKAGHRLVLHGLSSEMLHALLMQAKMAQK
jgi:hypothetical protein